MAINGEGLLVAVSGNARMFRQSGNYVVRLGNKVLATAKAPKGGGLPYPRPPDGGRWQWLFTEGGGEGAERQARLEGDRVVYIKRTARTSQVGPSDHTDIDAITDVPGIKVGHWTDEVAATGCTVVLAPAEGAVGGVCVNGGAPGTRETDLLRPGRFVDRVNAICLAGGSAFGLDAASGVMRYLEEQDIGVEYAETHIPIVPAAILFDLGIGRADVRPDAEAGYAAAQAASEGPVAQGSVGAGTGATVAKIGGPERRLKGGLGTACERGPDGLLAGAVAAVNGGGDIVDPEHGTLIAGPRADESGELLRGWELVREGVNPRAENTTLAVVATNAALTKEEANRVATVAHDGFARTIWPVHTRYDGDVVFVLATGEVEIDETGYVALEALAARAVQRAIVRGVVCATGLAGVPSAQEWTAQVMEQ